MLAAHRELHVLRRFQITHISVALHMLLIVILAKAMFYVSWRGPGGRPRAAAYFGGCGA